MALPYGSKMMDQRRLKITKVPKPYRGSTRGHQPSLRLCGEWLRKAGFLEGDTVTIQVEDGRLTVIRETAPCTYTS